MKLFARIRFVFVFTLLVLFSTLPSAATSEERCTNDAGTVTCSTGEASCSTQDGKFSGECYTPNSQLKGDDFDADVATKVTGQQVTAEELRKDPKLQQGLRQGQITTNDGRIIKFRPIDQIRAKYSIRPGLFSQPGQLDRTQIDNYFRKLIADEDLNKAIDAYRGLVNNPLVTINNESSTILEDIAARLIRDKNYADAIKVLQLNVEISPESPRGYFNLAQLYDRRSRIEEQPNDKENAIKNYEAVLNTKIVDKALRERANERLRVLRQP